MPTLMTRQCVAELEVLVEEYISEANEHEDHILHQEEVKRLRDLVLYAKSIIDEGD